MDVKQRPRCQGAGPAAGTALERITSQTDCLPKGGHGGVRLREEALRDLSRGFPCTQDCVYTISSGNIGDCHVIVSTV